MAFFSSFLKLFGHSQAKDEQCGLALRRDFQARYLNFKLLLTANNTVLDAMSRMEQALGSAKPFSMTFVRGICTETASRVYQIIRHLNAIGEAGRYAELFERFQQIQKVLDKVLAPPPLYCGGPLLLPLRQTGAQQDADCDAPLGFVLTTAAYARFMAHAGLREEIRRRLQATAVSDLDLKSLAARSELVRQCILEAELPPELQDAVQQGTELLLARSCKASQSLKDFLLDLQPTALLSAEARCLSREAPAANAESEAATTSGAEAAAGLPPELYPQQCAVPLHELATAYKAAVADQYSVSAMLYRLNMGIRDEDEAISVSVWPARKGQCRTGHAQEPPRAPKPEADPADPFTPKGIAGTPVYETLRRASEVILPLNLLDPDSPDFRPKYCRTLHDIIRYCHERAVLEMFQFGQRNTLPAHCSRQLYTTTPMQFWVLDLDDGVLPPAPGEKQDLHFVRLEEIISIPMLALWQGISAKPWGGPPPVDARGFMSILVEATCNPDLDPAMPSHYTARNYFMVARNFCSLQSRFGFHFSSVEALVGERRRENYVTFRFKGGAASLDRRIGRAKLIDQLLKNYGFETAVQEDALWARVEGLPQNAMERLLVVLGFMTIHTRQLDMVMAQSGSIHSLTEALREDIADTLERFGFKR